MAGPPNTNGITGAMPAYYDSMLFAINFKQLVTSGATLQTHNHQTNIIWQSDPGLPGGRPFISVINAIPADGMNPLWVECQITFNPGHTPRQFFSDDEVNAAAASGEITVTDTHEIYRCSVIGKPGIVTTSARTTVAGVPVRSASAGAAGGAAPGAASGETPTSWGAVKKAYR
jgi:hypothetical protein